MKVTIDRFEEDYAVCEKENSEIINIEKSKIPYDAKEGDVLLIDENDIVIDIEETQIRKKEVEDLTENLWD